MTIDQQVIKDNVDRIGSHIGTHGDLGIPCSPLGGIDPHLDTVKDHASHDDPEIGNRTIMRFCGRPAKPYDRACQDHKQNTDDHRRN